MVISSFVHDTFGEIVCASRTEKVCFAFVFVPCIMEWMKEMWDEMIPIVSDPFVAQKKNFQLSRVLELVNTL